MKVGVGLSREKKSKDALAEAYKKSLQAIQATKADLVMVVYSYEYGLDVGELSEAFQTVFRSTRHFGFSSWSAWSSKQAFEGDSGVFVLSFKDPEFDFDLFRVNSLREKGDLWASEIYRLIEDTAAMPNRKPIESMVLVADSLNFKAGQGLELIQKNYPELQALCVGTSFAVPQCSLVHEGTVFVNGLIALAIRGKQPWIGLIQGVRPELEPIRVNRMSENLVIEIDQKPAFYKLSEHLMQADDLPMMSPDEFRKYMGHMYIVEKDPQVLRPVRVVGEPYRVVALLGSEMTTGMVAVANSLDFRSTHFLGQRKAKYVEEEGLEILASLKEKIPNPSLVLLMSSHTRNRDKDRRVSDLEVVRSIFTEAPIFGFSTNGEYLGTNNQLATLVMVIP